jgi:GT2 family glycosyltransferase
VRGVDADVVICSWAGDDREVVLATLRAAGAQALPGRIHLVDMSPSDDLAERAAEIAGVSVHREPGSSGLGDSRQRGIEHADARYVAFLDSDATPRPGWLAALVEAIEQADVAVAGGPVLPLWPPGRRPPPLFGTQVAGDFLSMLDLGPRLLEVPRVLPGNMLVDRELTGGDVFSPELGRRAGELFGAEEIEMMLRVRAAGRRIVYAPGAAVDHRTRAERLSWRWMWRRVHAAGREAAHQAARLEPLPRRLSARDRVFQALVAPAFVHGRYLSGSRAATRLRSDRSSQAR